MKIKKYTAASMTEAMKLIREELGGDAVILNSKPVYSGGFLGLFRKRSIEVIAAIDPKPEPNQMIVKEKVKKISMETTSPQNERAEVKSKVEETKKEPSELVKEIDALKRMIEDLRFVTRQDFQYPEILGSAHSFLNEQEIDESLKTQIMDTLLTKWRDMKHDVTKVEVQEWMRASLFDSISWITNHRVHFQKKYISIVGPTGVGKTTTLAKIAAETMLKDHKKVAFITTDTYRIAAIDQLKTYAKILNVPIEVAYNLEDFKRAADRFSHYDFVFIDTAGRNFRNAQYVKDLGNLIDFSKEMETYLVLSLTSKQRDMDAIYHQFSSIPIKQVIFTKVDETASYGAMINFIQRHQLAPAYLTNGQNVPDDIIEATPTTIVNTVFGVNYNERPS